MTLRETGAQTRLTATAGLPEIQGKHDFVHVLLVEQD